MIKINPNDAIDNTRLSLFSDRTTEYRSATDAWASLEDLENAVHMQGIDYAKIITEVTSPYPTKNNPTVDDYLDLKLLFEKIKSDIGDKDFQLFVDMAEGTKTTREIAKQHGFKSNKTASNRFQKVCGIIEGKMFDWEMLTQLTGTHIREHEIEIRLEKKMNRVDGSAYKGVAEEIDESAPVFIAVEGNSVEARYIERYNGKYVITGCKQVFRRDTLDGTKKWTRVAIWGPEDVPRVTLYSAHGNGTRYQPALDDLHAQYWGPEKCYITDEALLKQLIYDYTNFKGFGIPETNARFPAFKMTVEELTAIVYGPKDDSSKIKKAS